MPPVNDNFADAIVLAASGTTTGNNVGATIENDEPDPFWSYMRASVWYSWTAPRDMLAGFSTISAHGDPDIDPDPDALYDTMLLVYTGSSLDSLVQVVWSNDAWYAESALTFEAVAGTTYMIKVCGWDWSYYGYEGTFSLRWGERVGSWSEWQQSPPYRRDWTQQTVGGWSSANRNLNHYYSSTWEEVGHYPPPTQDNWAAVCAMTQSTDPHYHAGGSIEVYWGSHSVQTPTTFLRQGAYGILSSTIDGMNYECGSPRKPGACSPESSQAASPAATVSGSYLILDFESSKTYRNMYAQNDLDLIYNFDYAPIPSAPPDTYVEYESDAENVLETDGTWYFSGGINYSGSAYNEMDFDLRWVTSPSVGQEIPYQASQVTPPPGVGDVIFHFSRSGYRMDNPPKQGVGSLYDHAVLPDIADHLSDDWCLGVFLHSAQQAPTVPDNNGYTSVEFAATISVVLPRWRYWQLDWAEPARRTGGRGPRMLQRDR